MNWIFFGVAVLGAGVLALRRYKPWLDQVLRPQTAYGGAGGPALRQVTPLDRRIAALRHAREPLERQRLLGEIVAESRQQQDAPAMNKIFRRFAGIQVQEAGSCAEALKAANGGRMPEIPAFALLAEALESERRFEEALAVCDQALGLGLKDSARGGFAARVKALRKKIKETRPAPRPPKKRRRGGSPPPGA